MSTNDAVAFESDTLFEADAVAAALDQAGVPYYRSVFTGGIERGMPAAPAQAFGQIWLIRVPQEAAPEAAEIVRQFRPLVVRTEPERSLSRMYVVGIILGIVMFAAIRLCG